MSWLYFWLGFLALFLNKIRYSWFGYRRARDFSARNIKRAVDYDRRVVVSWKKYLREYNGQKSFSGKNILELGPGADLGTGLIMLSEGALGYNALDANDLAANASAEFYESLIKAIGAKREFLLEQVTKMKTGRSDKLHYTVSKKFDPGIFSDIDLIFSQAAFEHFDDLPRVAKGLFKAAKKGAVLVAEIDLATHTGFLVGRDPLNIYRYPKTVYDLFHFSGQPNRLRPDDYSRIFSENGWKDIRIYPLKIIADQDFTRLSRGVCPEFLHPDKKMSYLSIIFCAKK